MVCWCGGDGCLYTYIRLVAILGQGDPLCRTATRNRTPPTRNPRPAGRRLVLVGTGGPKVWPWRPMPRPNITSYSNIHTYVLRFPFCPQVTAVTSAACTMTNTAFHSSRLYLSTRSLRYRRFVIKLLVPLVPTHTRALVKIRFFPDRPARSC